MMLKYTTAQVTFREIPDEVTLCINISGCPIRCPDCHSKELWGDIGTELSFDELKRLIEQNNGITCVCIMGGDSDLLSVYDICNYIKINYPKLKTAWYSGRNSLDTIYNNLIQIDQNTELFLKEFDYIKIGPYIKEFGGLDNPNTNQKLYQRVLVFSININDKFEDITYKFWKNDSNNSSGLSHREN